MDMNLLGQRAKQSSYVLASLSTARKNEAITTIADILQDSVQEILEANATDLKKARESGIGEAMLDRLMLNEKRVNDILSDMRKVVLLDDDPEGGALEYIGLFSLFTIIGELFSLFESVGEILPLFDGL